MKYFLYKKLFCLQKCFVSSTILNGWQTNIKSLNHVGKIKLHSYRETHTDANLWTKWEHEAVFLSRGWPNPLFDGQQPDGFSVLPGRQHFHLGFPSVFCLIGQKTWLDSGPRWLAPLRTHRCIPTSKPAVKSLSVIPSQWLHVRCFEVDVHCNNWGSVSKLPSKKHFEHSQFEGGPLKHKVEIPTLEREV